MTEKTAQNSSGEVFFSLMANEDFKVSGIRKGSNFEPKKARTFASLTDDERASFGYIMVDWLTIYQDHPPGSVPVFGKDLVWTIDIATGEKLYQLVKRYKHEGSHDTNICIRSDGTRVEVSGNPSAWERQDNVFGFQSIQECVAVYNKILVDVGLPPFVYGSSVVNNRQSKVSYRRVDKYKLSNGRMTNLQQVSSMSDYTGYSERELIRGRPIITQIHITENLFVGSYRNHAGEIVSYVPMFFRHMSGYVHQGHAGYLYPDGFTVEWNGKKSKGKGSSRVYHSMYDKANNLRQKAFDIARKKVKDEDHAYYIRDRLWYLEKLADWCDEVGLARNEAKFKSRELADRDLQYIENWSYDVMCNVIRPHQFYKKMKVEETRFDEIVILLKSQGISEGQAIKAELIHSHWVMGKNLDDVFKTKRTKYHYRKILLSLGVDIFMPCDISRLPIRVEQIKVSPAVPPEWYQLPESPKASHLKLVA